MNIMHRFYHGIAAAVNETSNIDRVKFFWEKSSAGIEWPEFDASF